MSDNDGIALTSIAHPIGMPTEALCNELRRLTQLANTFIAYDPERPDVDVFTRLEEIERNLKRRARA